MASTQAVAAAESPQVDAAAVARLRELELALEIQCNELAAIRIRERDTASQLVLANARSWAANGGDDSSGGNGSYATVPSTSSTASQHGLLASLASGATQFLLGRRRPKLRGDNLRPNCGGV